MRNGCAMHLDARRNSPVLTRCGLVSDGYPPFQLAFLSAAFFVVLFFAALFLVVFPLLAEAFLAAVLPPFSDFSESSFSTFSPRADLAASTLRWSAASRSTTSPEDFLA